jgi:hypothetical protein
VEWHRERTDASVPVGRLWGCAGEAAEKQSSGATFSGTVLASSLLGSDERHPTYNGDPEVVTAALDAAQV